MRTAGARRVLKLVTERKRRNAGAAGRECRSRGQRRRGKGSLLHAFFDKLRRVARIAVTSGQESKAHGAWTRPPGRWLPRTSRITGNGGGSIC